MKIRLAHRLVLALGGLILASAIVMAVLIPRSVSIEFEQFVERQDIAPPIDQSTDALLRMAQQHYQQHGPSGLSDLDLESDRRLLLLFESGGHWSSAEHSLSKASYDNDSETLSFSLAGDDENMLMIAGITPDRWVHPDHGLALVWLLPSDVFSPPELQFEQSVRLRTYLVIVPVVLTILALMYWLVRRAMAPVERLNLAMRGIGDGTLPDPLQVQSNDEVGELTASFNDAVDRLHRMQLARQRMTSDVAHELRTPITNVRARLEGMVDGVFPTDKDEARILLAEVMQLSTLVEDLQQLSLAESGELSVNLQEIKLPPFLLELEQVWKPIAESRKASLEVLLNESGADKATVAADPVRLRQLIGILIDNAVQHGGSGVAITICCRRHHDVVELVVEDDGPGVEHAEARMVFDRLYRADASRNRETGGNGLGLAIARQLATMQGAAINAQAAHPRGLRMVITFHAVT